MWVHYFKVTRAKLLCLKEKEKKKKEEKKSAETIDFQKETNSLKFIFKWDLLPIRKLQSALMTDLTLTDNTAG